MQKETEGAITNNFLKYAAKTVQLVPTGRSRND
jgi:hypothetical protein